MERPAAKARPAPKVSEPFDHSASSTQKSSSSSVVLEAKPCPSSESRVPKAKSRPSNGSQQLGARAKPAAKANERILRPRLYLPDTVVWFDRGNKAEDIGSGPEPVGVNFREVSNYSSYRGYKTYVKARSPEYPKFILSLGWHQVLDRSRTEGTWNDTFPQDSIVFLQRLKAGSRADVGSSRSFVDCDCLSH